MKVKKTCSNCSSMLCCIYDDYSNIKSTKKKFCLDWSPGYSFFCELIDGLPEELKIEALYNPYSDAHDILRRYYKYD